VVRYQVDRGVALCRLNRPDRLNAWTNRMAEEYGWVLRQADDDPDVRVVVVTGAGPGFCAGADFKALDQMASAEWSGATDVVPALSYPLAMAKPVIAAVNGPAAGLGFALMCFCDLRFAAEGAKLTTSFARLGLPAEQGLSWMLTRLVGPSRAADLLLSSRVVLAEEALAMGLVNAVHPVEELPAETMRYARTMAKEIAPSSLRVIKAQLLADLTDSLEASTRRSIALADDMIGSPDFVEGVAALRQRRPPHF
jgi:enoyl-CoA hydratase/carnithine racemase